MSAQSDRLEFSAVMGAEGVPFDVIERTLRDARTLHRIAENQCNGYRDPEQEQRDSMREENCEAWISGTLAAYGIVAQFQGDPRGAVVKLRLPSGRSNDFGGEGFYCVPTQ